MNPTEELGRAKISRLPKALLIESLRRIEGVPTTRETAMVRRWLIEEVEARYPAASAAVEAAFEAAVGEEDRSGDRVDIDYVGVLLANVPASE